MAAILEFTITRYFFHPENDFNGFLDHKNLGKDTKFITPGQIHMELYWAAILDAILNYTFLPHIWNVYPSFFQSPMGPLHGSRVKIRGRMIAHRTPLSPRTNNSYLCAKPRYLTARYRAKLAASHADMIQYSICLWTRTRIFGVTRTQYFRIRIPYLAV